ncbi:KR domain-containing protein, partial [Actinomadura sp. DC4]|uniref:KR domain-containing protein n=1 Tax=Actinomadura sp. DC4 TaxID=3055069 RepID=UPI0025AF7E09
SFQHQRYWLPDVAPPVSAAGPVDEEEARFWAAVEQADASGLAGTLGVDDASLDAVLPALSRWRRERRDRSAVDSWRHRVEWRPVDLPDDDVPAGSWLVVRPPGAAEDWARACTAALEAGGDTVRHLDPADLTAALLEEETPPARVLSLLALDEREDGLPGFASTLTLLHAMAGAGTEATLHVATRGAVAAGDDGVPEHPAQARLWGLGRVAAVEHPTVWGGLVDLPPTPDDLDPARFRTALAREDEAALRPAGVFGRRLVEDPLGAGEPSPDRRLGGAALVTGGGPAVLVARWLAGQGAEPVFLLDPAGAEAPVTPGVTVVDEVPADVAIGTLVHASVSGEPASLAETDPAALAEAIRADVDRVLEVEDSCRLGPGDTIIYFSSIAAVWGGRDHGAYAAANAHLEALAQRRRAEGVHAVSVAWGLWDVPDDEEGQAGQARPHIERARRQGLPPLDPRLAFAALHRILERDDPYTVIADVAWQRFAPLFTGERRTRLFDEVPAALEVIEAAREDDDGAAEATEALRRELAARPEAERHGAVLTLVRSHVASVLRYAGAEAVDPQRPFKDLGFDSLAAVELRNGLRTATGLRLPATLVFDRPSPDALARWLLAEVLPADAGAALPALGRLDDLEAALAVLPPEDLRRSGLVDRLQTLLWRYTDSAVTADDDEADLEAATADEMFALIDRDLGA